MKIRLFHIFNSIVLLLLFSINSWIYIKRDEGYAYKEILTYNQLYQTNEQTYISNFLPINDGSVKVEITHGKGFTEKNKKWKIQSDNISYSNNGDAPIIKLKEGENIYTIIYFENNIEKRIVLGISYTSKDYYKRSGKNKNSAIELAFATIPVVNNKLYNINDWIQTSQYTTKSEINSSKQILFDSIKINASDSSITKIKKISHYILRSINAIGIPNDSVDYISPFNQFEMAKQGKINVWCGNYSDMYAFFANNAGIPTRCVSVGDELSGIVSSGHTFNESFVKELNKWVFVDLTSKTICPQAEDGSYLNTIDLYNAHQLSQNKLTFTTVLDDTITKLNYDSVKSFYSYFFNQNTSFKFFFANQFYKNAYSFSSKTKRYISQEPTFASYGGSTVISNEKFYLKRFIFFLTILFFIYWLGFYILYASSKKKNSQ